MALTSCLVILDIVGLIQDNTMPFHPEKISKTAVEFFPPLFLVVHPHHLQALQVFLTGKGLRNFIVAGKTIPRCETTEKCEDTG